LQGKHASLLNARYTVSARTSFEYQKKIATGPVRGAFSESQTTCGIYALFFRFSNATDTCGTSS
jgi:hypothetical protein